MRTAVFVVALALSLVGSARAQDLQAQDTDVSTPRSDALIQANLGAGVGTDFPTVSSEFGLLYRWRYLSVGATGSMAVPMGEDETGSLYGGAAQAGFGLRHRRWRLDLLGAFGVHRYVDIGQDAWGMDPGYDATLPYAGGQAQLFFLVKTAKERTWNPNRVHFMLGLAGKVDRDLRETTEYRQMGGDIIGRSIGGTHALALLTFGVVFDAR